ncbi:D-alanyl-D-alanine carboxypeptidase family protein, partial [Kitasatospora sp. NPDC088134]|uniref:D-alanyl-D-alanine carboxypeptidase family protein n=1 Tax=Kitasatospora sp. NPDC088134 TaxID=3364071 RepID=UPI0037FAC085
VESAKDDGAEEEPVAAGPEPTMTLRLGALPPAEKDAEEAEPAEPAKSEDAEDGEEEPVVAGPEPTMTLRLGVLPPAVKAEDAEEAEPVESAKDDGAEEEPVAAGPEPTMTLRLGALPPAAKDAKDAKAGDSEPAKSVKAEPAEPAEPAEDEPVAPEPTMTLRVDKDRPERTVRLRAPEDGGAAEAKTVRTVQPGAASAPAAAAPVAAAQEVAPQELPPPGPDSTIEALEVLKALSARPMTPFRRAMKRVVVWGVFLSVVLGVLVAAQLLRPLPQPKAKLGLTDSYTFGGEPLNLPWPAKGQAAAAVMGVGDLGSSGEEKAVPIASVTKVMNAYLILQAHPLKKGQTGPVITVDKQAAQESANADESKVTLTEGQQISQYEALEMLMLPSANNVARLLARWDSGSEDAFVKKMNDTAAKLGMVNTVYADPAGYNADTKSTAKDQLKLAAQVMKDDTFRQVVAEPDTRFNGQRVFNTNGLLGKNGNIGVKTGSSTPAQSAFMWAAVKDVGGVKRTLIGVTLSQPATKEEPSLVRAAQPVSQKINVAAQEALTGQTLAKQGQVVGRVSDGLGGSVPLIATKDLTVAGWSGITARLTLTPVGTLAHTLPAGTQVGTLSAGDGDDRVEVPVTLQTALAPPSIGSRLLRLG